MELICSPDVQISSGGGRQSLAIQSGIPVFHSHTSQCFRHKKKNKKLGSKSSVSSLRLSVFSLLSHLSISLSLSLMEEEGNGEGEGRCLMMLSLTVSIQQAAKG